MKKSSIHHSLWQMAILAFLLSSFPSQEVQAQCSGVSESDSLELVALYNATNGDNWSNNDGWLIEPVEEWFGITLTDDGCHVQRIYLVDKNLQGELIDLQLPYLEYLDLYYNSLSGSIPDFSNLSNLTYLNLNSNDLTGSVPDFSNLPNLAELYLGGYVTIKGNSLTGTIPDFSRLSNLVSLDLAKNELSGTIPDFSNLPNLRELRLGNNELSGTIPDFSNLPNLRELRLTYNDLSGNIPDFSNLSNLVSLYLYGSILSDTIPDFSNLPNLRWLSLRENTLSGVIPNFSNLPNLERLSLYENNLSGTIPDFSNLPNLRKLELYNNDLSGTIPNFNNLPNLDKLEVCPNNLQGGIPSFKYCPLLELEDIDFSCVQSAQVSGYVFYDENANCIKDEGEKGIPSALVYTDDEYFRTTTDENGFYVLKTDTGTLNFTSSWTNKRASQICPDSSSYHTQVFTAYTDSIGNLNYAYDINENCPPDLYAGVNVSDSLELVAFYNATDGDNWKYNRGWLVDPVEQWLGITLTADGCNIEEIELNHNELGGALNDLQLPYLRKLDLANSSLSGSIPDFSDLPSLVTLRLRGNDLTEPIPDFSNLPNLEELYLEHNNLSGELPDFSNLPNLVILQSYDNAFSGEIPDFSNLQKLTTLWVSDNELSGELPDFSNLPNLEILELYHNKFSGTIPDFGHLPNLIRLGLDNNTLTGLIPDFSNLPNLDWLQLSSNNLSGSIPDFSNLANLSALLLSNNELTGSIPDFSNLPKLFEFSVENNKLSGSIPDFSNLPNLFEFYLDNNNLSGAIPNFSNLPHLEWFSLCPNNLQGVVPNFMFCESLLGIDNIDFSCVQSAQVSGYVFYDENANCIKDEDERGIPNASVYTNDEQFMTRTDEDGFYVLKTDTGAYTFASYPINNSIWSQICPEPSSPYTATFTNYTDNISDLNYAYEPRIYCPQMKVEIGSSGLTRCFDNLYTVNYCNIGTAIAENAYIELYFPYELIPLSSSIPYTVEDDHLIFELGDVDLFESGSFTVLDSVSCDAVLGNTACVEAYAYPNDPCIISASWNGSDIKVKGECLGDEVQFIIKNTGSDMTLPSNYKMYEDDILADYANFELESGDSIVLNYSTTGATFRLTVVQNPGHPSRRIITEVVEGCGDGPFTSGFVNSQWDGDDSPIFDSDCQEIVGSFDPNDKTVFPSGVLEGNHIPDSIDLTYRIRFQNTGNAVAYRVIIIDTIDTEHLELPSLELGAYSHDFELDVEDGNVLIFTFNDILLPDSTSNEPASHGFITYTLKQKAGNVIGDLITNEAAIYFDYNQPVITNKVLNTVGIPDTTTADFVYTSTPQIPIYQDKLAAIVDYNSQQMSIQINEVQAGERFSMQVLNILGQEMFSLPNLSVPLHQEALPQVQGGVYIYNIQSSKGRVARGKVLVR